MEKTKKFEELSEKIFDLIGGKENLSSLNHCVTRLRFNLKDKSLANVSEIDKIPGVIGSQWAGDQLQVVIGADVLEAYNLVCQKAGITPEKGIDENLDGDMAKSAGPKKKFSFKDVGKGIMAYISPIMLSIIPVMIGVSMCKTIAILLGPSMLNVISETSDIYILLNFLYNAFFHFLPIFLGYSAAKSMNINPLYGIYLGTMILAPDFMAMIGVRESFTVFGLSVPVASYAQTFLPVVLGVVIMAYLLKLLERIIPKAVKSVFVPTLAILIMAPVMFAVCCPLGSYLGNAIGSAFIWMSGANVVIRILGAVLLAVLLPYMVLSGTHGVLVSFAIATFLTAGAESYVLPTMLAYNYAVYGVGLGAIIKLKKAENKTAASGYFISGFLGGVTEPVLFGTVLRHKSAMKALLISCAIGGLFCGIFQPTVYALVSASAFTLWAPWTAGGSGNLVMGLIMTALSFVAGAIAAILVKYEE